jgi:hypothetical protein
VTAALGCFLGIGIAETADADDLTQAYGEFAQEAQALNPDYQPQTVNTDGWSATQQAWKSLFPGITIILCFLHAVLAVQQRCRREPGLFSLITDKLWNWYHSLSRQQFAQRLRRLKEWVKVTPMPEPVRQKLQKLIANAPRFQLTFEFPQAYRTSNQVDRLMNYQDRLLYAMQYFHGTKAATLKALRAMALLWNFHPYGRKVQTKPPYASSPFEALNGFRYHDNWLRNLLIASSLNGRGTGKPVKHKLN